MIISSNLQEEDKVAVNLNSLILLTTLATKVIDRTINNNSDILYAPKDTASIEDFYSSVDVIISDKIKNALLGDNDVK